MSKATDNHARVSAAIGARVPDLTSEQQAEAAAAAMAAIADCAAGMSVDAFRTHLASLALHADAQASTAERGYKITTGEWRPGYYEQQYPGAPDVYRIRQQTWEQVAVWLRNAAGQVQGRHVLVDAVALKAVTDYLAAAGASATVHDAMQTARVWQTQRVYRESTYTRPRLLSGRDLAEGDHLAFAGGHLLRDLRPVIDGGGVQWLLVDRVLVDGTAHPGVHLPDRPEPYLPTGDERLVARITASQSARLR